MEIKFGNHTIGLNHPTYFIADIAANHDGDLERAKLLIRLQRKREPTPPNSRTSTRRRSSRIMASHT